MDLSENIKLSGHDFIWINKSEVNKSGDTISILATAESDFFNSPVQENGMFPRPIANASILLTEFEGDFIFKVKVKPVFKTFADAAAVMIYENENVWAKFAYEKSDMPGELPAIVTVVTNRISDDANAITLDQEFVHLQVSRVGDTFAFHYSLDNETYVMARLFTLPVGKSVWVGLEAQAPLGEAKYHEFSELEISSRSIENIRKGV